MWIVRLALRRPYTFVVLALLIAVLGVLSIATMSTDIFPSINIPVVTVIWSYTGLSPTEMEGRIVTVSERAFTTTVNGIEHIESVSLRGVAITRLYFHPNVPIEAAIAQVNAQAQQIVRALPPGIFPPLILQYNAASVPVLLASLSSDQLSEQELNDLANNFIRTELVTVQGASVPLPYGGKVRIVQVDVDPDALYARGLSPPDVNSAILAQNVILPAGTAKMGTIEYDVAINSSPEILGDLNKIPIRYVNGATAYPEQRQRLDPEDCGAGAPADAQHSDRPAVEPEGRLPFRPERLRTGSHQRGAPRGTDRRLPDGAHDPAVSAVLAEHSDRRDVDPISHPDFDHHARFPASDAQRHDARRSGAGGGNPCGRRHG